MVDASAQTLAQAGTAASNLSRYDDVQAQG
jgi:hypothetical protein